jgi:hypothetical protein
MSDTNDTRLVLTAARAYASGRVDGATAEVAKQRDAKKQAADAQRQAKQQWRQQQIDAAVRDAAARKAEADAKLQDARGDEADLAQQQQSYRDLMAQQHQLILSHTASIKLEAAKVDTMNHGMPSYICYGVPESAAPWVLSTAYGRMFYLAYVDAHNKHGASYFNMIFLRHPPINYQSGFQMRAADFQKFVDENSVYHNSLIDLTSYLNGDEVCYAMRWTLYTNQDWQAYTEVPFEQIPGRIGAMAAQGYGMISQSYVQKSNGQILACGLFGRMQASETGSVQLVSADEYQRRLGEYAAKGMLPSHLDVTEINGEPRFSAVWQPSTFEAYEAHHHLAGKELAAQHEQCAANVLLQRVLAGYSNGDKAHYAAVWVRAPAKPADGFPRSGRSHDLKLDKGRSNA